MIYWQVLDLETCGLDPKNDEIAEIAIITCKNNEIIGIFNQFYEISSIKPEAAAKNNLSVVQLKGWPKFNTNENRNNIRNIIKYPIFAHNSNFDTGFLKARGLLHESHKHVDTVQLCKKSGKGFPDNKLQTWLKHYGLQNGTPHTALNDAFGLTRLILQMGWQIYSKIDVP